MFDTPLFGLLCWGANMWYAVWFNLGGGRRLRNGILADPLYGPQWRPETWLAPDRRGGS
jgi:hypothetical protein